LNEGWQSDFEINAKKLLGCREWCGGQQSGDDSGLMAGINNYIHTNMRPGRKVGCCIHSGTLSGSPATRTSCAMSYIRVKDMGYFYEDF